MTTREMLERVFWDTGERSDLSPYTTPGDESTFDITLPGSVKLLRLLNTAAVRIANWKYRNGQLLHFRELRDRLFFSNREPVEGTVLGGITSVVNIEGLSTNVEDSFDGWYLSIEAGTGAGQVRLITGTALNADGVSVDVTLDSPLDTAVDTTSEYRLYKNFYKFVANPVDEYEQYHIAVDPTRAFGDILKVRDVTLGVELERSYTNDAFTQTGKQLGTPTSFLVYGRELWFDVSAEDARSFEILYVKNPVKLVAASDVLAIPEVYHEAVVLWATHNVLRMGHDFDGAYATKRELEDFMEMTRISGSFDMDMSRGGLVVYG